MLASPASAEVVIWVVKFAFLAVAWFKKSPLARNEKRCPHTETNYEKKKSECSEISLRAWALSWCNIPLRDSSLTSDDMLPFWELECWACRCHLERDESPWFSCVFWQKQDIKRRNKKLCFYVSLSATCSLDGSSRRGGEEENNYYGHKHNLVIGSYSVVFNAGPRFREKWNFEKLCVIAFKLLLGVVFLNWKLFLNIARAFDPPAVRVCKCVELVLPQNAHDVFSFHPSRFDHVLI